MYMHSIIYPREIKDIYISMYRAYTCQKNEREIIMPFSHNSREVTIPLIELVVLYILR